MRRKPAHLATLGEQQKETQQYADRYMGMVQGHDRRLIHSTGRTGLGRLEFL